MTRFGLRIEPITTQTMSATVVYNSYTIGNTEYTTASTHTKLEIICITSIAILYSITFYIQLIAEIRNTNSY